MPPFKSRRVSGIFPQFIKIADTGAGSVSYKAEDLFENAGNVLAFSVMSDVTKEVFKRRQNVNAVDVS